MGKSEQWGPGKKSEWHTAGEQKVGNSAVKLIYGEHPHSRSDNRFYALIHPEEPTPFDGHRLRVGLSIEERNYSRSSGLTGDSIRGDCRLRVTFDDRVVYGKTFRRADQAAAWFVANRYKLTEHAVDLREAEELLINRRVYYREVPGIVTHFFADQGAVVIEPEGDHKFQAPIYWNRESWDMSDSVKEDILSETIWWFRE